MNSRICELLDIEFPLVAFTHCRDVVVAVSKAGGCGVLGAVGMDPKGVALIFAVDRILDMLRTVVNVTGDATIATVIASSEGQLRAVNNDELMS